MYIHATIQISNLSHVTWVSKLGSPVATATDSPLQKKQACPHATTSNHSIFPHKSFLGQIISPLWKLLLKELSLGQIAVPPPDLFLPELRKSIPSTTPMDKEVEYCRVELQLFLGVRTTGVHDLKEEMAVKMLCRG